MLNVFRRVRLQPRHFFYIYGTVISLAFALSLIPSVKHSGWKKERAKVTFIQYQVQTSSGLYSPKTTEGIPYSEYKYTVNGKEYTGSDGHLIYARTEGDLIPPTAVSIEILYDPRRPWVSIRDPSFPLLETAFLSSGIVCMIGCGIYAGWRRSRRPSKT